MRALAYRPGGASNAKFAASAGTHRENGIMTTLRVAKLTVLLGLIAFASACVVEPREGYWDRAHNRYYHEHGWHGCGAGDEYCR